MKKSQILAALALAFALGVVAPAAGTVNTVSAYTVNDGTNNGKASCDEVNWTVAGVKADSKIYVGESTLFALNEKYSKTENNADVAGTEANSIQTKATAITGPTYTSVVLASPATIANLQDVLKNVNNMTENITHIVSGQAKTIKPYQIWSKIFAGIENKVDGKGDQALKDALTNAFTQTGNAAFDWATKKDLSQYTSLTANPLTGITGYNDWKALYTEISDVNEILARRENAIAEYKAAFTTYKSYVLTDAGNTQLDAILGNEGANKPGIQVKDFMYLVNNGGGDWLKNRTAWYGVYEEVKDAGNGNCNQSNTEYENYDLIDAIAAAYRTATWDRFAGKDNDEIAVYLMNLGKKNPSGTGEGTNKPNDDKNEGNKAPDTGILANAEGNASTTVAMVAGIATALTAAGAGVVAYRNARRSSRK